MNRPNHAQPGQPFAGSSPGDDSDGRTIADPRVAAAVTGRPVSASGVVAASDAHTQIAPGIDRAKLARPPAASVEAADAHTQIAPSAERTQIAPGGARAAAPPPRPAVAPPRAAVAPPQTGASHSQGELSEAPSHTPMSGAISSAFRAYQPPSDLPQAGTRIHQYELIRELGRGGMGAVFLARDTKLGRRVAIKFLQSNQQAELNERFKIEARATARCSHENIVIIHEVDEYQGNPYMVLEYLSGQPLSGLINAEGKRVPPGRAVEIITSVVKALACAHQHEIVHRDLKPDNIFLTDGGTVKVLDFGIAKLVHQQQMPSEGGAGGLAARLAAAEKMDTSELTRAGSLIGTIPYMSPEQWMGFGVDHQTDIWAVGILLFKMVAGHHPLAPLRGQQLMVTAMLDQPMPSVREAVPDLPDGLVHVIDRCLQKHKEQRYGSAEELLEALQPLAPGRFARRLRVDESPYAGLSAFQETDAARFFGRNTEIAAMVTRLRDRPLIGVVGPSGVGKSSFVRAGVVPALKQSGESWESVVIRPGRSPLAALAGVAASMLNTSASNSAVSSTTIESDISEQKNYQQRLMNEPGFLGTVLRSRARKRGQKILLFIDQFEELYTLNPDPRERMAFTACLAGVADDATTPLRVALSIRSDFLDRAAEDPRFMAELSQGLFFLMPPGRGALREAIVMPAEMAGYRFESERMVGHMIETLENTSGALPLLQFTATKLWEARDRGRKLLSESSYHAMGGTEGALASHADAVMGELTPHAQNLVRTIFLRLVTPERTRAIVSVSELAELHEQRSEVERLIEHLVSARLLVVQTSESSGTASVEIVHESLLHSWPRLRTWLDENQDDAAFLEQLRNASRQWDQKGRPGGLLWRGEAAVEAKRFVHRYRGQVTKVEQEFLAAVLRLSTRSTRVRRAAVIAAMLALVMVAAGSTVAMVRIKQAETRAQAQAAAAVEAEEKVRNQNRSLETALEKQKLAEAEAKEALAEAQAANEEVMKGQEKLAAANGNLRDALERANRAKQRARRERMRAERNEKLAQDAALEATRLNDELKDALERERERLARLENQLGSPIVEELH
ncbi:serine/threonine-protein kinase [Haliangium ochraceum]|uniref:non-specific serine/threonine protein kinase n=1 Tax=Haliangium ochraceum (strain DSM 14365 / JCM 11303 / SMP-2) TaxID=502025 RepID=D0LSS5_HALO1|nr:serine/threonine-protein kinase [Haliangium ochraceum]ACY17297.1 serine/threonine protein kinase [Haliangium ochraceum DSM 14365]